jgi:hypothetical protein
VKQKYKVYSLVYSFFKNKKIIIWNKNNTFRLQNILKYTLTNYILISNNLNFWEY